MINTYWLISLNEENYNITKNLGFTIQGFNSFEKRKVSRMKPDDRVLYFLNDLKCFAATASIVSEPFEDDHTSLNKFPDSIPPINQILFENVSF